MRGRCSAIVVAACLAAGCASLAPQHDAWTVRASGSGAALKLHSTSHVNHGRPAREAPVERVPLHAARRGNVSIELHHDAAIADAWTGSAWKFGREVDKALGWLQRLAGGNGARVVVTLVDDERLLDAEHVHAAPPPTVDLYFAAADGGASQSPVVGRALAKALHEMVHALSASSGVPLANRYAEEHRAALVEACYLLDTLRPGDTFALRVADAHAATGNVAILQSRAAAAAVMGELRALAGGATVRAGDRAAIAALRARCDGVSGQAAASGR